MRRKKIVIIGGGNLGKSIANGILDDKEFIPQDLIITRRKTNLLTNYSEQGVKITSNNLAAVEKSEIIILCVKPHKVKDIILEIKPMLDKDKHILISTITGVGLEDFKSFLNPDIQLFRAMPNTAISIKESMTCVSTSNGTKQNTDFVLSFFDKLGKTLLIDDELMASATVLAASGIAFALRYIRAAMQGGIEIGFSSAIAQEISAQTIKGASKLVLENNLHPESEIDKVTTPLGITISGLNKMEQFGFSSSLIQGLLTSYEKIKPYNSPKS